MSGGNGQGQAWSRIITGEAFTAGHEPPDWLIDGIIQKGRLYSCTSPTSHGKTAVFSYVGCVVPAGRKFAGLEVVRGNVLYLAGENPDDLRARLVGMRREMGLKAHELPYVLPVGFLLDDAGYAALMNDIAALVAVTFVMVIVDTAAVYSPVLDEINNNQQLVYAQRLRTLTLIAGNPAVVVLCHPPKNATRTDLLPRGGGAFLNEMDGNLTLWSDELGEQTTLSWLGKLRGPPFDPVTFRLRSVATGHADKRGHAEMTIIAEPLAAFEAVSRSKQAAADHVGVLKAVHHHPDWSQVEICGFMGWPKEERYKVSRAFTKLIKARLMEEVMGTYKVTQRGENFLNDQ